MVASGPGGVFSTRGPLDSIFSARWGSHRGMPGALIVQSDASILLDVHDPDAANAREDIAPFTELEKSPEHMHTYRITPLSLWNAAAAGLDAPQVNQRLETHARFPIPANVRSRIDDTISRFGKLRLVTTDDGNTLRLEVDDADTRVELAGRAKLRKLLRVDGTGFLLRLADRGTLKQELIQLGYPVEDLVPLSRGEAIAFGFRARTDAGLDFGLRDYQTEAADTFYGGGTTGAGYGTVVLPCGAGKTVVGMAVMDRVQASTLILTTNIAAVHQWIDELVDKTTLDRDEIGEYTGQRKEIRAVTVATYQVLVWRPDKASDFPHFDLFRTRQWGLVIYDEVHLLPAPVFRVVAEIQAMRRLGLTATLVREDGHEADVFSLVGPKRYDVPWKQLEQKGWIATALCYEVRLDLPKPIRTKYALADRRAKFRIASENPLKVEACRQIVENHWQESVMVIGQYLDQLAELARVLEAPLVTGTLANKRREEIYRAFREGTERVIVVSKVANFAIDLPDASVAIQVSGTFGSRQEEAQRLGRILRPKAHNNSHFYTLVSNQTVEETFAANRQRFLTEQGYAYRIDHWDGEFVTG